MSEKEVTMDVKEGGAKTRTRRRRRGAKGSGGERDESTLVTKAGADIMIPAPAPASVLAPAKGVGAGVVKKPTVVLAPPKKKVPKVMLVPKGKPTVAKPVLKKTFKAKRVKVTINNTAKTQKQHRSVIEDVDAMTDDQIRAAACAAKLSRRETVGKAPITLLRQMIKDYQLMKKMLH
jgi:hypothetical protein